MKTRATPTAQAHPQLRQRSYTTHLVLQVKSGPSLDKETHGPNGAGADGQVKRRVPVLGLGVDGGALVQQLPHDLLEIENKMPRERTAS